MVEVPKLEASAVHEDSRRVRLNGEIDFSCAASLVRGLLSLNGTSVEVDLSDVIFIDAGAIGALITVKNELEGRGCDLYVIGARRIVRRVLELVGPDGWAEDVEVADNVAHG